MLALPGLLQLDSCLLLDALQRAGRQVLLGVGNRHAAGLLPVLELDVRAFLGNLVSAIGEEPSDHLPAARTPASRMGRTVRFSAGYNGRDLVRAPGALGHHVGQVHPGADRPRESSSAECIRMPSVAGSIPVWDAISLATDAHALRRMRLQQGPLTEARPDEPLGREPVRWQ